MNTEHSIIGDGGGPYSTHQGALDTHIAEVHNQIVNELFHLHTGVISTIAIASNIGDTSVTLINASSFNIGDAVQLNDGDIETTFPIITAKVINLVTFDRPLDLAYAIGDNIEVVHTDLKTTAGTLAAPIIHTLTPHIGEIWYINRIIISMTHASASADDLFGGIASLINGVVLRANINGQYGSFSNWKSNSDILLDMFDINYSDKAGPGLFGTSARGSFSRVGVLVKLDGNVGDFMDILVQDDLTGLNSFFVNGQGYIENV